MAIERGALYKGRNKMLRDKFGQVADEYEKYRFEYPAELYEKIFAYSGRGKMALEIGIGTGKATSPFLAQGYDVVAIEPVGEMLNIAQEKYKGKNITFVNSTFESYDSDARFDMVYAASSFHWVSSEGRLQKVYDYLEEGGTFARFKTINVVDGCKNYNNQVLMDAYLKYLPDYLPTEKHTKHVQDSEYKLIGFKELERDFIYVEHEMAVEDYLKMIDTYTEYLALDSSLREEFENYIKGKTREETVVITQKCTVFLAKK